IIGLGTLPVKLVATVFYACTRWPAQAGPTATQVVWTSSFVGYDPVTTTNKIQPANWIFTAITIIIMALLYT
ncbi:MAG: C4-dicarboxylate ABC transporter, partial [Lachnospira sp.]|nr:C4-dicarboxylate ABC transporter [Lachnospira sp.]